MQIYTNDSQTRPAYKESFLGEAIEGLCFSTQPPKVKDGTIIAEVDIYSLFHVPYCLPRDVSEEQFEQNWSEDTALFYSVGNGERV